MMGASFQTTVTALFFNELLSILLTSKKLRTLQHYSEIDPLLMLPPHIAAAGTSEAIPEPESAAKVKIGLVSALFVLVLNIGVILLSMMFFVVCVRLFIHAGYFYHAATHPRQDIKADDALRITLQAQVHLHSLLFLRCKFRPDLAHSLVDDVLCRVRKALVHAVYFYHAATHHQQDI
jgi:hypothetical protein